MLCKHEVTGSIPVSSTKSYSQFLFTVPGSLPLRLSDIDPETGRLRKRMPAGFKSLRARSRQAGTMIFDNKIDWVTRLKRPLIRREARRRAVIFKHV